jgi:predicted MFS family arabinose efflux permease
MSTSYLLAVVSFQPVHTSFSNIFGRKPALHFCCSLFCVGLLIFGTSSSPQVLILGRTIQGLGGGGLEALSEVILTEITTLEERPRYLGLMAFFWASAGVVGPAIGGALVEYASWRWLAWIVFPVVIAAWALVTPATLPKGDPSPLVEKIGRVNWTSIALFVGASFLTLFPVTAGGVLHPWFDRLTLLPFAMGLACSVFLLRHEKKAKEPILALHIFGNRSVVAALLVSFVTGILFWCLFFYPTIFFQSVWQHEPLESAVDGFSFTAMQAFTELGTALLIGRLSSCRWLLVAACLLATVGSGVLTLLSVDTGISLGRALFVPAGIGLGMTYPALTIPVQAAVSAEDVGDATGLLVFTRNLGAVVGMAAGSAVFTAQFSSSFEWTGLSYRLFGIHSANDAVGLVPHIPAIEVRPAEKLALLTVYASSFQAVAMFVAVMTGVGTFAALFVTDAKLEVDETETQPCRDEVMPDYGTL